MVACLALAVGACGVDEGDWGGSAARGKADVAAGKQPPAHHNADPYFATLAGALEAWPDSTPAAPPLEQIKGGAWLTDQCPRVTEMKIEITFGDGTKLTMTPDLSAADKQLCGGFGLHWIARDPQPDASKALAFCARDASGHGALQRHPVPMGLLGIPSSALDGVEGRTPRERLGSLFKQHGWRSFQIDTSHGDDFDERIAYFDRISVNNKTLKVQYRRSLTDPKARTHVTTFDIGEKKMPHLLVLPLPFLNLEEKAIDALLGDEAAAVFPYRFGPCD